MSRVLASAPNPLAPRRLDMYPLQLRFLVLGVSLGFCGGLWFLSPVAGLSLFVLCVALGALWRRDEPPILAFCIGWQWMFAAVGLFYLQVTGVLPGRPDMVPGVMDRAVLLSLAGFLVLAVGIRLGLSSLRGNSDTARLEQENSKRHYHVRRLFWWVIAVYTIEWFAQIIPIAVLFDAAQIIDKLLVFRLVLLALLLLAIAQQRRGYPYGALALAFVMVPTFAGPSAAFAELLLLPIVILLAEWRPWTKSTLDRNRGFRAMLVAAGLTVVLAIVTVFWIGAVKGPWRVEIHSGQASGSIIERVQGFAALATGEVQRRDLGYVTERGAARVSSGVSFFADVLDRVPAVVPHEGGRLTRRALLHSVRPRFLFPEKESFGSSSWLVQRYAGKSAAGDESGTSIGLAYLAEFYIDFGVPWMFVPILLYGLAVGLMYRALRWLSPSHNLFASAVIVLLLISFSGYEGEFALTLGGLIMNFLVFSAILYFAGAWLHRNLTVAGESIGSGEVRGIAPGRTVKPGTSVCR